MKIRLFSLAIITIIMIASGCKKPPEASFTHSSDNYEEGDTVNFMSTSTDATDLDWDFGDGSTSTEESPFHIYNSTGTYTVSLTATNDDGSDEASESVTIKDPTILAFYVTEGSSETVITGCLVSLFETEADWENFENVAGYGITDNDGYVEFYHAKPIVYHLWAMKEVTNGMWVWGGYTGTNTANEYNGWLIPCEFISDKKSEFTNPPNEVKILEKISK